MEGKLKKYAGEFWNMGRGQKITDSRQIIFVSETAQFTRRSLKHFIESRTAQRNSWDDVCYLLEKAGEVTERPQLKLKNPNQRNYPGSFLLGSFYEEKKKAVIVVLDCMGFTGRDIVSLHFTKKTAFFKLLNGAQDSA
jgi:hypothetical protein